VAVSLTGVVLGVLLGGRVDHDVGPFHAQLSAQPAVGGGSSVEIPPLGSLHLDSHAGPGHLTVRLDTLDEERARALVNSPDGLTSAGEDAADDVESGVLRLGIRVLGVGLLGALLLAALVYRSAREVAIAGTLALVTLLGTGAVAAATFRPDAIQEPRYEGLLTNAPAVVGDARRIANRYDEYRAQLQHLVANVSRLYSTISTLPVYEPSDDTTRVLHISDLHLNPAAWSVVRTVVEQFDIDVVVDTGDINDWGSEPEAAYVASISLLEVPYLYIRGNHDSAVTAAAVAGQPNAVVLQNSTVTVAGLTFGGIGDPRFTPDKTTADTAEKDAAALREVGGLLAETIAAAPAPVDVALVHDPATAPPLAGACRVVLAGHTHKREVRRLDASPDVPVVGDRTLLMVEGSTGGAGLRGLESDKPLPLALSVLYFDTDRALQAYDDITVGGTGVSEVTLQRHIVRPDEKAPRSASPAPSPS
jgi:predicted phosphodiesterase